MVKVEVPLEGLYGKRFFPPTPISLVSAVNEEGLVNVAPISQILFLSYNGENWPKTLVIGIASYEKGRRRVKRIYQSILETREFVVNIPSDDMADTINKLAQKYPSGFDKFKAYGLTPIPSLKIKTPSVRECKIHFECQMIRQEYMGLQHDLIFGRILAVTADEAVVRCSEDERMASMRPIYWFGIDPNEGLYYSIGRMVGRRRTQD